MSGRRYAPLFEQFEELPKPRPQRFPVTVALRESEVGRLTHSEYGVRDLALVQVLGTQLRYLRRDQVDVLYPGLSTSTVSRRLGQLWKAQWINRETWTESGQKHHVLTLGKLGIEWLRFTGVAPRWVTPEGWAAKVDSHLAHWLGIGDIWAQLMRFAQKMPGVQLTQFETELDYSYGSMDARTKFKPDAFFELQWGSSPDETLMAYVEFDRATEPLTRWQVFKVANARKFAQSARWPWGRIPVDYWIFADRSRLEAMQRADTFQLGGSPFGWNGQWVLVPWNVWGTHGVWGSRDWVFPRQTSSESRWRLMVMALNNRQRRG